jgi:hypothetical protein
MQNAERPGKAAKSEGRRKNDECRKGTKARYMRGTSQV